MVVDLFERLLGDRRERLVCAGPQPGVQLEHVGRHDELTCDRLREVAVGLLDDPGAAELRLVAEVREVVFGASVVGTGEVQERPGMTEQIEGDVAERDILFEFGRAGDPLAELLREDQGVVAEPEGVLCLLYTSPSPRDKRQSRMPSSA